MVELDVPAMVHVSAPCNANFHATGAYYLNADTTAFMQFLTSDLYKDSPTLRFIIWSAIQAASAWISVGLRACSGSRRRG